MNKIITKITLIVLILIAILGISTIANATYTEVNTKLNPYVTCPTCNQIVYVEQATGNVHVTCRNGHEFDANVENEISKVFGATVPNMPQCNTAGNTGMMPQYYVRDIKRRVSLNDDRLNLNTSEWNAKIDGEIVYCSLKHSYVRYGQFDPNMYLLFKSAFNVGNYQLDGVEVLKTLQEILTEKENTIKEENYTNTIYTKETTAGRKDVKNINITGYEFDYDYGGLNPDAITIAITESFENPSQGELEELENNMTKSHTILSRIMNKIFEQMDGSVRTDPYEESIDGDRVKEPITGVNGPEIVVLESDSTTHQDGYALEEQGTFSHQDEERKNIVKSYILTALENAYNYETGAYASEYTLNDIQTAYWWALYYYDHEQQASRNPGRQSTQKGKELYNKAEEYATFVQNLKNSNNQYVASLNADNAKVIANRNNQTYIVGPFSINYPYYEDISYIKALTIDAIKQVNGRENHKELIYSEENSDFEIILSSGGVLGSNGTKKQYPASGENFFIKFKAQDANYPDSINFKVKFEYINGTTLDYEMLDSNANIYRYEGHIYYGGTNSMDFAQVNTTTKIHYEFDYKHTDYIWNGGYVHANSCTRTDVAPQDCSCDYQKVLTAVDKDAHSSGVLTNNSQYVYGQPYIKMSEQPIETHLAQKLLVSGDGERIYKTKDIATTTPIDLTIELGGFVWVDDETGKESVSNGLYDSQDGNDKRVKNVIVTLYKEDGTEVSSTRTDNNGEYKFTGLNAMFKYYVKFTYNGQYYEPTTYTSPYDSNNGWGKGNWQINSNATDKINEREAFNQKFASIGSSPNNYIGGQTYTREYLLNNHIIDEFGNVITNANSSMKNFANACMMDAYTKASNSSGYDCYPIPNIYTITNNLSNSFQYRILVGQNGINSMQDILNLLYPSSYYINLGLKPRQDADIAIKKDISKVTLEINGQTHEYTYDTLENKENAENEWDISVRLSDAYYNTKYSRELYKSDYLYKTSNYGNEEVQQALGKSKQNELEVYVTYKIMVRNQSMSIRTRIDEIVDYYDEDYEYVDERSFIRIPRNTNQGMYKVNVSNESRYGANTQTNIDGYDVLYVQGLGVNASKINEAGENTAQITDGIYLDGGQTAYVYLTFKVKKDENSGEYWLKLDEQIESGNPIGVGKENIVEVNGYSTIYANGTTVPNIGDVSGKPAGIIDRDSTPGNLSPEYVPKDGQIQHDKFEDDTDKSPNIRIILNRNDDAVRVISGSVWEDERTKEIGVATIGDGTKAEHEKLINGVTVQLVELMENGQEFVWREFGSDITGPSSITNGTGTGTKDQETPIINAFNLVQNYQFGENKDGAYAFKSFVPGKYVVRFIYGDTVKTVAPTSLNVGGLNEKSYNGQDYKSTTYQQGIMQHIVNERNEEQEAYKTYTWRKASTFVNGQEILGDILTTVSAFKDDSSNNETANAYANEQKAYLYNITASDAKNNVSDAKDIESRRNEVINYSKEDVTNYIAEVLASHKSDYATMNDRNQLLNDLMQNTKMVAETGLIVVEFEYDREQTPNQVENNAQTYKITNVDLGLEERAKSQLVINKEVTNVKLTLADGSILFDAKATASNVLWRDHKAYNVGYKDNFMDERKFSNIENIRNSNSSKFGLIQLSMDEELMHGATIKITYNVTVSNIGEVDYKENSFYYKGNISDVRNVVTTKADKVIDYVANNLQFYAKDNTNWKVITKDEISSQGLVNSSLNKEVEKYNTIIVTEKFDKELVPNLYKTKVNRDLQDSVTIPLVLTQLITAENDSDDLTYRNIVEIVQTSNTVGRRQEYSVVGNQNPTNEPQELDTDKAEVIKILPPFGNAGLYIIIAIITITAVAILAVGIIFIKKKVLIKK